MSQDHTTSHTYVQIFTNSHNPSGLEVIVVFVLLLLSLRVKFAWCTYRQRGRTPTSFWFFRFLFFFFAKMHAYHFFEVSVLKDFASGRMRLDAQWDYGACVYSLLDNDDSNNNNNNTWL